MPIIYSNNISGQPPQAIPSDKKDEEWNRANMDWMEDYLKAELAIKSKRLIKNYNIANGIIDIEDYIPGGLNDYNEVYDVIEQNLQESLFENNEITVDDIHNYPLIPIVINTLVGELQQKFDHVMIKAIDDMSINEYYEYKKSLVADFIINKANQKIQEKLAQQELDPQSEEYQQAAQQMQQEVMSLPAIQTFMNRNYKNNYEDWANRIMEQAIHKYGIDQLEPEIFKHQLIADEAYIHIRLNGDDLQVETWNPKETVCIKPAHIKYTTHADLIGHQYWTTISDVVSKYANKINHQLIERNSNQLNTSNSLFNPRLTSTPDDNKSGMAETKKLLYFKYLIGDLEFSPTSKVLVTEGYWMTQRRLGHLKAVYEGQYLEKIVDDTFKVSDKPVYDVDGKLIGGEEIEYFYAPQVYQGTKLNFSYGSTPSNLVDENEYLDESIFNKKKKKSKKEQIDQDIEEGVFYIDIKPVEYQFTDELNPYKPKIPVVGCEGFETNMNVGVNSIVDKTKTYQVLYNSALNQIDNFMKTEIGLFYLIDQKLIPRESLDGSWGKHNWMKWLLLARDSQLGVLDSSTQNTEGQQTFQQSSVINLLKNPQFESRIQLAQTFKTLLFETLGVTPQRIGDINKQETATGINQALDKSYSQTSNLFFNHTHFIREFKSLLLDAEKYMESKKPISRVQYLNSDVENIMFEIDTDQLLIRRFNIYLTTNSDTQRVLEQLRQLAIQNNTSGATILDLATIIESSNVRDIKDTLKASVENLQKQEEQKRQHEEKLLQQKLEAEAAEKQAQRDFDAEQNDKDRIVKMYEADVRATGWAKDNDLDKNQVNDALEIERFNLEQDKNYSDILNQEYERQRKQKELDQKLSIEQRKMTAKEREIESKEKIKQMEIKRDYDNMRNDEKIARINLKNKPTKK